MSTTNQTAIRMGLKMKPYLEAEAAERKKRKPVDSVSPNSDEQIRTDELIAKEAARSAAAKGNQNAAAEPKTEVGHSVPLLFDKKTEHAARKAEADMLGVCDSAVRDADIIDSLAHELSALVLALKVAS